VAVTFSISVIFEPSSCCLRYITFRFHRGWACMRSRLQTAVSLSVTPTVHTVHAEVSKRLRPLFPRPHTECFYIVVYNGLIILDQ